MVESPEIKFGEILSSLIEIKGFSGNHKKVANEIGVSPSSISHYLKGQLPSVDTLIHLAVFFEVNIDYLLFGRDLSQAETIDYGHLYRFIDRALFDVQDKTDRQTWLLARVSRIIHDRLMLTVRDIVDSELPQDFAASGVLTDQEVLTLEGFSETSYIISLNLQYDMQDPETPGRFMEVVAKNLSAGREYNFLLPHYQPDGNDWNNVVNSYHGLLQAQCNNAQVVFTKCRFKRSKMPVLVGCGFYRLDIKALQADEPILYEAISPFINHESWIGYVIPPSNQYFANPLMDQSILDHALAAFMALWKEGVSISTRG